MPGVVDRAAAAEGAGVLTSDATFLPELDAHGPDATMGARISTGRPTALASTEYLFLRDLIHWIKS